jgi:hypothetical protein
LEEDAIPPEDQRSFDAGGLSRVGRGACLTASSPTQAGANFRAGAASSRSEQRARNLHTIRIVAA